MKDTYETVSWKAERCRLADIQADRLTDMQQADILIGMQVHMHTDRHAGRQTEDMLKDRHTDMQADRQTY